MQHGNKRIVTSLKRPVAFTAGDMFVVRPLLMAGIPCGIIASPDDAAHHSRLVSPKLKWRDPTTHPEEFVENLLSYARTQPEPPILFYDMDATMVVVSRYRDRLAEAFRFVIPDSELLEDLADKGRFQLLAERLDLPVPPTRRFPPSNSRPPEQLELRFPVVVKPLSRSGSGWEEFAHSNKALRVNSAEELRSLLDRLADANIEVIAQELVPGPESSIESYHVYVDSTGAIAGEFTGKKVRTMPVVNGITTALVITDQADVTTIGREVIRRMDFRGVAKLDFKRGPDGRLHLLEINPRFNLWNYPGAVAGVNIPAMVYADLAGLPRPQPRPIRPGVTWCSPMEDMRSARESGISRMDWLRWALSCDLKGDFRWNDPMPTWSVAADRVMAIVRPGSRT